VRWQRSRSTAGKLARTGHNRDTQSAASRHNTQKQQRMSHASSTTVFGMAGVMDVGRAQRLGYAKMLLSEDARWKFVSSNIQPPLGNFSMTTSGFLDGVPS